MSILTFYTEEIGRGFTRIKRGSENGQKLPRLDGATALTISAALLEKASDLFRSALIRVNPRLFFSWIPAVVPG